MFGVVNPPSLPRAPRELPGSIEEPPSTFEPDLRRLLRGQVHATLSRMVDELVGEEGREGAVRVLSSVESYAAAMRGVLADLSEPTSPRARRRGYGMDESESYGGGGMVNPMPALVGPPGTDGFLGDLMGVLRETMDKTLETNRDGAVEHKLQTLTATAARLQGIKKGPMREQLQEMLDRRMGELRRSLPEDPEELPAPQGTVIETGTLVPVDGPHWIDVEVIVLGESTRQRALSATPLGTLRRDALLEADYTGRPEEDFEIRTEEGVVLSPSTLVGLLPGRRIFLNPAVGAGGADEAPPHDHFPAFTGPTFPESVPADDF